VKFGIMNLFPAEGKDDHQVLHDTLEEIKLADELGFDSAWLAEHHFSRYGILGNPLMMGAAVAQSTSRILIGTAVVVLPFHDPIRLAEDAVTLDVISGGRLRLGVGRGYQPLEFAGFNREAEDSKAIYAEMVEILRLAWTEENWSFEGRHFSYQNMNVFPKPVVAGGPPLLHATVSPDSYRDRGLAGESIITSPNFTPLPLMKKNFEVYRDSLIEGGHDPADFDLPFMQQIWCGPSRDGLEAAATAALTYYRSVGKVIPGSDEAIAAEAKYYDAVRRNIDLLTLDQALTHGGNFGSVDLVVDTIGRLRDELGITHYIGWFNIPSIDRQVALRAMETFATEVIPQLSDVDADRRTLVPAR
jgi:alkanesulfonate monooxygenase SsuD/methylene tetrahydromethanopterin reductase-like flavin-dependent oxidoreductase (luciferase family)